MLGEYIKVGVVEKYGYFISIYDGRTGPALPSDSPAGSLEPACISHTYHTPFP
jgi:hypothetical protein